jgi:hypothetical protein
MSVSRVKYAKNYYPVQSFTYDTGNNLVTIVTPSNHNLWTGLNVSLTSDVTYGACYGTANVTSANTFSIKYSNYIDGNITNYEINGYLPGTTGPQTEQTLPRATGTDTVIQSFVNGAGGASYSVEVSLDKAHWISIGSVTHASVDQNTSSITIKPGWAYYRANVTSVGANTNLVVMSGE